MEREWMETTWDGWDGEQRNNRRKRARDVKMVARTHTSTFP